MSAPLLPAAPGQGGITASFSHSGGPPPPVGLPELIADQGVWTAGFLFVGVWR